ncbi:hypothetical protein D3C80_1790820 [compost metagenome]
MDITLNTLVFADHTCEVTTLSPTTSVRKLADEMLYGAVPTFIGNLLALKSSVIGDGTTVSVEIVVLLASTTKGRVWNVNGASVTGLERILFVATV